MAQVSIILPVHNGGDYLREALNSVFAQTYTDFEVIVLENASQDHTLQVLDSFDDPRLMVRSSKTFLTIEENWESILSLKLQPYVTFLSHDDKYHPSFLETVMALTQHHPDASVFTTHFQLIGTDSQVLRSCKPVPFTETGEDFLRAMQRHQRDSFGTGYVIRSSDFISIGGFPKLPGLMFADDLLFYFAAKRGYKVCAPSVHFDYRYHLSSAAHTSALSTTYKASMMYLDLLRHDGYMATEENRSAAEKYVQDLLVRQHRALLVNLAERGTAEHVRAYHNDVNTLRSLPGWTGDHDSFVKGFQLLLALPSLPQRIVVRIIRAAAALTWRLRNQ